MHPQIAFKQPRSAQRAIERHEYNRDALPVPSADEMRKRLRLYVSWFAERIRQDPDSPQVLEWYGKINDARRMHSMAVRTAAVIRRVADVWRMCL